MPPIVRILPRFLLVYLKRSGIAASDKSRQEGHFTIDCYLRWRKSEDDLVNCVSAQRTRLSGARRCLPRPLQRWLGCRYGPET